MKKIPFISTLILLALNLMAQQQLDKRMDFKVENIPVSDALLSLCEKANLSISFQSRLLEDIPKLTFFHKNKTINYLLTACLKGTELGHKWENNRIVLYQKPPPNFIISGFVEDSLSGERLVSATVYDLQSGKGTTTNEYGFYSLAIPRGEATLNFSYLGFQSQTYRLNIKKNLQFIVPLQASITLEEVVVIDTKTNTQQGLSIEDAPNFAAGTLDKLPAIGGEPDIFHYFKNLSGVQASTGNFGGMHVRGGNTDQNLVLLDGVPIYNASHSFGLFSIFNHHIVKNARLYKGQFPARFSGRLSSVLDIQTKEGNNKHFNYGGAISLIATSIFAEGPLKEEKTSFFVSARRTHIDPILKAAGEETETTSTTIGYHFYDINAKVNHIFSDKDRIYVSFYKGADNINYRYQNKESFEVEVEFELEEEEEEELPEGSFTYLLNNQEDYFNINWGNTILSARWNHLWNNQLFSNTTLTYSEFRFNLFSASEQEFLDDIDTFADIEQYSFDSNIQDVALKIDFDYALSNQHYLKFGGGILERIFKPVLKFQEFQTEEENFNYEDYYEVIAQEDVRYVASELNFYVEDNIQFSKKLNAQIGLHNAIFITDNQIWTTLQPRIFIQYQLHPKGSLQASFNKMSQFLHVLSPAGISMPFDLWVPSTRNVAPQNAAHLMAGTTWKLPKNFRFSTDIYYKKLNDLVTYQTNVNTVLNGDSQNFDWEQEITVGQGWNYGIETALVRDKGNTKGFINYTWSKADRKFDGLSNNQRFPFQYNRTHSIKIGLSQKLGNVFNVAANWTFGTGQFTTPRVVEVYGEGATIDVIELDLVGGDGPLNTLQLPDFHQLNVNFNWSWAKNRAKHNFSLNVQNVYNRKNPLFPIQFINIATEDPTIDNKYLYDLPLLPSFRYAITF